MGKVMAVISMSLDGYITGPNVRAEAPMGDNGDRLHEWAMDMSDARNRQVLSEGIGGAGVVITGRSNYNLAIPWWGANGPTGDARLPVLVVSHSKPDSVPESGVYEFVGSLDAAMTRAKTIAGNKNINVMGGANIIQQFLRAGLLDELHIQLVPVLLGGGTPLFDQNTGDFEAISVIETPLAMHLGFRVKK
jgi:dihydrofolate reductase